MRHLRVLLRGVLLTRVEVRRDNAHGGVAALAGHGGLKPAPRVDVAFGVVEDEARLAVNACPPTPHGHADPRAPLDPAGDPDAVPFLAHDLPGDLLWRANLLHEQDVRVAGVEPRQEAALVGRSDAVEVDARYRQGHCCLLVLAIVARWRRGRRGDGCSPSLHLPRLAAPLGAPTRESVPPGAPRPRRRS